MPTKNRVTNFREIVLPDHLGAKGEEFADRRSGCRGPLSRHRGATAAGCVKSRPVKAQEAVRQWANLHDCCQVCWIDAHIPPQRR